MDEQLVGVGAGDRILEQCLLDEGEDPRIESRDIGFLMDHPVEDGIRAALAERGAACASESNRRPPGKDVGGR